MNVRNWSLAGLSLVLLCAPAISRGSGNVLTNGDFESASILGVGQSEVGPQSSKALASNTADSRYPNAILAIPHWTNSYSDVGFGAGTRDAGISTVNFSGSAGTRYAFINNWNTRLSQVSSLTAVAGGTYEATILFGAPSLAQGGVFQLWAGSPSASNPDNFDPSAVLLGSINIASSGYTAITPNVLAPVGQWVPLTIDATIPLNGAAIGQPLTISFETTQNSAGPTNWDNASLSTVPEPAALSILLAGIGLICRARRRDARGV